MASPKPYTANLPAEFFWSLGEPEIIYWQIFDVDNTGNDRGILSYLVPGHSRSGAIYLFIIDIIPHI